MANETVFTRYQGNPIITPDQVPGANSIFNSAVIDFGGAYVGVFRIDGTDVVSRLHLGRSRDAIKWDIDPEPLQIPWDDPDGEVQGTGYDPRITKIDDTYYITWCNDNHGPTIGLAETRDFTSFRFIENCFPPFNRNGVLFPRKIGGQYAMLHRPSDPGHTPFGDIFLSRSPDLVHWGRHRHVMSPKKDRLTWQCTKIGAGPVPIETTEGWLLIYHGVLTSCNGFVYSMGAALLDLDQPWKVLYRTRPYLLNPRMAFECVGDVPNVVFPCAALSDADSGRIAIYYGAADTVTALAFCQVDELIDFIKSNSEL